jgi:hypothetical protein
MPRCRTISETLAQEIATKISEGQAHRLVVNLKGSTVTGKALRDYLQQDPIANLKEIILIDQAGNISNFVPNRNGSP